jgi:hypothetical protein
MSGARLLGRRARLRAALRRTAAAAGAVLVGAAMGLVFFEPHGEPAPASAATPTHLEDASAPVPARMTSER